MIVQPYRPMAAALPEWREPRYPPVWPIDYARIYRQMPGTPLREWGTPLPRFLWPLIGDESVTIFMGSAGSKVPRAIMFYFGCPCNDPAHPWEEYPREPDRGRIVLSNLVYRCRGCSRPGIDEKSVDEWVPEIFRGVVPPPGDPAWTWELPP